jgi:MYXO-CTERM domain-containing protein
MRRCSLLVAAVVILALAAVRPAALAGPQNAHYADDADGVFWFMHISDIHIGTSHLDPTLTGNEVPHLQYALGEARTVINPAFLVATGDLTNGDGGDWGVPTSGQSQAEWDTYKSVYTGAGMTASFYYDVVGNHDEYSISCPSLHWYLDNSLQGQTVHAASFGWTHTTTFGDYFFYGFNATGDCVAPLSGGDGVIIDAEYAALVAAIDAHPNAPLSFFFAHQGIEQPQNSARVADAVGNVNGFWVHGHVHEYKEYLSAGGRVVSNEVDSLGKADSNNLAVGAIDHDAFIYRATGTAKPWPFVVITAPVAADLRDGAVTNPYAYSVCLDRPANPVRALVFSKNPPSSVTVAVGSLAPVTMTPVTAGSSLYSGHVDTRPLATGFHDVVVTATVGADTNSHTIPVDFAVCNPVPDGGVDARPPADDAAPADGAPPVGDDAAVGPDGPVGPPDATPMDYPDGGPAHDAVATADDAPPAPAADAGVEAGTTGTAGSGGCGCRAADGADLGWLAVLGLAGVLLRVRRRR